MASRVRFVTDFLSDLLEENFVQRHLTQRVYFQLRQSVLGDRQLMLRVSRELFKSQGQDVEVTGLGPLRLVELKNLTGKDFPFIVLPPEEKRRGLRCFVGCRFTAGLPQILAFNLRTILDAWNVEVRLAGASLSAASLLGQTIGEIKDADFCVFDNRGTLEIPNVYIEVGIAWVLEKPMIFCEHTGRHRAGFKSLPTTGSLPVDLRQLTRVQFGNDEELCRKLYFGFPSFARTNGLT